MPVIVPGILGVLWGKGLFKFEILTRARYIQFMLFLKMKNDLIVGLDCFSYDDWEIGEQFDLCFELLSKH